MSDPVTNAEIEDVLSSIRRLVSEDSRNISREKSVARPVERERLVLTPALRVADDPAPAEDAAAEDQPWPTSDGAAAAAQEAPSDAAGVDANAPEPAADDAPPWSDPDATLFEAASSHMADVTDEDIAPAGAADSPQAEPADEVADRETSAEDYADEDDWLTDPAGDVQAEDPDADPEDTSDEDAWGGDAGGANEISLGATVEALETTIGETSDQWEPDGDGGDEYAGTPVQTLQWEDHQAGAAPDADTGLRERQDAPPASNDLAGAEETEDDDRLGPLGTEDTILDEESLRELVTDIVREELQGALGGRITRNVRKLVRREIHRALTAQELG